MEPQKKEKTLTSKEEEDIMSDISKATANLDNSAEKKGFLANLVRNAIEAFDNNQKYSWMIPFYQQYSTYSKRKQAFTKIRDQLEIAGLGPEIRRYHTKFNYLINGLMLGAIVFNFKFFKGYAMKIIGLSTILMLKTQYIDFFMSEGLLRQVALEMDTPTAQEIRNLYRFYLPEDEDVAEMVKKCEDYKKYMEVKRELLPKRPGKQ